MYVITGHFLLFLPLLCRNQGDDIAGSSSLSRVPGFQDFTSNKQGSVKKKRLQPLPPRRSKDGSFSFEDGEFVKVVCTRTCTCKCMYSAAATEVCLYIMVFLPLSDDLIATTPGFQRTDSTEYSEDDAEEPRSPPNLASLAEEYHDEEDDEQVL